MSSGAYLCNEPEAETQSEESKQIVCTSCFKVRTSYLTLYSLNPQQPTTIHETMVAKYIGSGNSIRWLDGGKCKGSSPKVLHPLRLKVQKVHNSFLTASRC